MRVPAVAAACFWEEVADQPAEVLGDGASFVINRTASTIHVQARPSGIGRLREIVGTTTHRANQQVSLEARILEVRLDDEYSLGINWSLLARPVQQQQDRPRRRRLGRRQTAASGGTALTFGVLDTGDFSVFVDALQSQGQVRVLSSPRVSTLNNQVGDDRRHRPDPLHHARGHHDQGVARTEFNVEFVESGVELERAAADRRRRLLSVAITPSVREQIGTAVTPDGIVSVPSSANGRRRRRVRVADGQAIALGGLRSTRKSESREGVPFLMDVPWLGQAVLEHRAGTLRGRADDRAGAARARRHLDRRGAARGSHRLVQLRRGFQWNSIRLDGVNVARTGRAVRLQGTAQAANAAGPAHAGRRRAVGGRFGSGR
jgi:MSHA biogenesis protein MshL